MIHFNKQGKQIDMWQYAKLNADKDYRRVGFTKLGDYVVSTVWVGLALPYPIGSVPLIFETMVFPSEEIFDELDCERYATEYEAVVGHTQMVYKWAKRLDNES